MAKSDDDVSKTDQSIQIPGDAPDYPSYYITFEGEFIKNPPIRINGPHHFDLIQAPPNVQVRLEVTRNPAEPGVPDLTITVKRKPPQNPSQT
jgi:hypothetical protein